MPFFTWIYQETVSMESNILPGGLYHLDILALWLMYAAKWALAGDERAEGLFLLLSMLQCRG